MAALSYDLHLFKLLRKRKRKITIEEEEYFEYVKCSITNLVILITFNNIKFTQA
jgi:hypothetical protein